MQIYENQGAEVYANGSAGHMNGTEVTKMKEVAFEKNPSEPMVYHLFLHTHAHKQFLYFYICVADSSSLTVVFVHRGSL